MDIKLKDTEQLAKKIHHWYSTWWGISILFAICLIFAVIISIGLLVFNYLQIVKVENANEFSKIFNDQNAVVMKESVETVFARKELETLDDPYIGNVDAGIVIVEFIDFKCPFCKVQSSVMPQLIGKYGNKIKIITRDFPMDVVHYGAKRMAEIASCANEQGSYWLVSDLFFSNQDKFDDYFSQSDLNSLIYEYSLDKNKMNECLDTGRGSAEVLFDQAIGLKYGVNRGTPTYFINGEKIEGAVPIDFWEDVFKKFGL